MVNIIVVKTFCMVRNRRSQLHTVEVKACYSIVPTRKLRYWLCVRNCAANFVNTGMQAVNFTAFSPSRKSRLFWCVWYNAAVPAGYNYLKKMCVVENMRSVPCLLLLAGLLLRFDGEL